MSLEHERRQPDVTRFECLVNQPHLASQSRAFAELGETFSLQQAGLRDPGILRPALDLPRIVFCPSHRRADCFVRASVPRRWTRNTNPTTAVITATLPIRSAACTGRLLAHFAARSQGPSGRARTGLPSMNRPGPLPGPTCSRTALEGVSPGK